MKNDYSKLHSIAQQFADAVLTDDVSEGSGAYVSIRRDHNTGELSIAEETDQHSRVPGYDYLLTQRQFSPDSEDDRDALIDSTLDTILTDKNSRRNLSNFATALQNGELENTLKHADLIGSRDEINALVMANQHLFEEMEPDHVLPELDLMCEDHFLASLNKDMEAVGLKPCSRDSYGEPIKWEPGTTPASLESLGKACSETFIDEARANGEIPLAQKKPTTFGKNRPSRGGAGRPFSATTANHAAGKLDPDIPNRRAESGPFAGSRFAGGVDVDALAAEERKADRTEMRARETARLDVEPEKPRSGGMDRA